MTRQSLVPAAAMAVALALVSCSREPSNARTAEGAPAGTVAAAPAPSASAASQQVGASAQTPDPCQRIEAQAELSKCWGDAANRAEARSREAYQKVVAWLGKRDQADVVKMVEEAQSRWEDYRDAQCEAAAGVYDGGSIAPMAEAQCKARLAEQRARELDAMMADTN
jgi:uncharacterized protein YecT (DUF1311 family)